MTKVQSNFFIFAYSMRTYVVEPVATYDDYGDTWSSDRSYGVQTTSSSTSVIFDGIVTELLRVAKNPTEAGRPHMVDVDERVNVIKCVKR